MKKFLFFTVFIFLTNIIFSQNQTRILLVGISKYPNLPKDSQLKYADKDAILLYNYYKSQENIPKKNIVLLINQQANSYLAMLILLNYIQESKPGDKIIFYFAGHGDVSSVEDTTGYLLFSNVSNTGFYSASDAMKISTLEKISQLAAQKNVKFFIILDACRSGNIIGGKQGTKRTLMAIEQAWNNTFKLVSCAPDQFSFEDAKYGGGHGIFTYYLSLGLLSNADNNKDKNILFGEIYDYVKQNVASATNYAQTPKIFGKEQEIFSKINKNISYKELNRKTIFENNFLYDIPPELKQLISNFNNSIEKEDFYDLESNSAIYPSLKILTANKCKAPGYNAAIFNNLLAVVDTLGYASIFNLDNHCLQTSKIRTDDKGLKSVAFIDQNTIITGSWLNRLSIANLKNRQIKKFNAHKNDITVIKYNPYDKLLYSGSYDTHIEVRDPYNNWKIETKLYGHYAVVNDIDFLPDGRIISVSSDKKILIWDLNNGNKPIKKLSHSAPVIAVKVASDGKFFITADKSGIIKIWNSSDYNLLKTIDNKVPITAIDIDPNTYFLFVAQRNKIKIYAIKQDFKLKHTFEAAHNIRKILVSPDAQYLFVLGTKDLSTLITMQISIPQRLFAYDLYLSLSINPKMAHIKDRLKTILAASMLMYIDKILNPLIEGAPIKPDIQSMNKAIAYIDLIRKLYPRNKFLTTILTSKKLLLQVYAILVSKDYQKAPIAKLKTDTLKLIEPYAAYPYSYLSELYRDINDLAKAHQNVKTAHQKNPYSLKPQIDAAKNFIKQGKFYKSIQILKSILQEQPNNLTANYLLAKIYAQMNNPDSAQIYYSKAFKIDPQNIYLKSIYVRFLIRELKFEQAKDLINKDLYKDKNYFSILTTANFYQKVGYTQKAEKYYIKLAQKPEYEPFYYAYLPQHYIQKYNIAKAYEILNDGLKKYYYIPAVNLAAANYYAFLYLNVSAKKQYAQKALMYYATAIKLNPYSVDNYFYKAKFLFSIIKNYNLGYSPYKIFTNNPNITAFELIKHSAYDSIAKYINKIDTLNPYFLPGKLLAYEFYQFFDKTQKSYQIETFFNNLENDTVALFYQYKILMLKKDYKNAAKKIKKLLDFRPNVYEAYCDYFEIVYKNGNKKKIEKIFNKFQYKDRPFCNLIMSKYIPQRSTFYLNRAYSYDKNMYYSILAVNNFSFLRGKTKKNTFDKNFNLERIEAFDNHWIVFRIGDKYGVMDIIGKIRIPANFDTINYKNDNNFECIKNNEKILIHLEF